MKSLPAIVFSCILAGPAWASDADTNAATVAAVSKTVLTIDLGSGTVNAPLVWTNGSLSQPETTDLAGGGKAVYSFTVTNEGDYVIAALVNAPGEDSNSFYVNVDANPEDPAMIWDIVDVTDGFQERIVSWRGNGEAEKDDFTPKKFHLTAGVHKLILVGREPAQLKGLWLRAP
jgi:hypothetical protein